MADIKSVGVIGAGQMGSGIAHVCALAGYDVFLNDLDGDRITAGISRIEHNMARQVGRGLIDDAAFAKAWLAVPDHRQIVDAAVKAEWEARP